MREIILEKNSNISRGWIQTTLENLIIFSKNGFTGRPNSEGRGMARLGIETITGSNSIYVDNSRCKYIEIPSLIRKSYTAEEGDLFVCRQNGNKNYVGKCAVFKSITKPTIFSDSLIQLRTNKELILSEYLAYFLNSMFGRDQIEQYCSTTAGNFSINGTNLKKTIVIHPSIPQQKRIVSKIEELFSLIDSTKHLIENMLIQLKRYKQSLLKSAFDGNLIPMAFKDHTTGISLENIEYERRKTFDGEQDLRKNGKKIKYVSPREPFQNYENLFNKSWRVVSLESICSVVESGSTPLRSVPENFDQNGIPLIKVENIMDDGTIKLRDDQLRITKKIHQKHWKSRTLPNDVLINIVGMPLGKIGLVSCDIPEANINQAIVVMRTIPSYLPKTLLYCLQSPNYYNYQIKMSTGVRQSNIKKSNVGKIPIPLIPIPYQTRMVEKIEEGLSLSKNSTDVIFSMLNILSTLKQSILKDAFQGKLVPQDPNDVHAEILLEKLKQEKQRLQENQTIIKTSQFKTGRIKNAK